MMIGTSEWERISLKRSNPSSWPSRRSKIIRLGEITAKYRFNSDLFDADFVGTLLSSKYLVTICRNDGSSSTTMIWPTSATIDLPPKFLPRVVVACLLTTYPSADQI